MNNPASPQSVLVPFNDLSRTPPATMRLVRGAIDEVLASGWYVMGPQHDALQAELNEYLGVKETVLVASGTDALELALAALTVQAGDLVMTVANAGGYTSIAARLLGAIPVFCDVAPDTLLITAETFEAALVGLPKAPKVVVITHLFGALADAESIVAVARRHGIFVLEDCAQSMGARVNGKHGGTFGDIATTSFYPTKNLGALGDGGAVFTNNSELALSVRRMRQYGWESKYRIAHAHGRNSRMDEMQAAIVRVKLPFLDAANQRRRDIHAMYETAAMGSARLVNSANRPGAESFIAHLGVLLCDDRGTAQTSLRDSGIGNDVHYPVADHRQNFPDFVPFPVDLPVTEWAAEHVLSVPLFPELTDDDAQLVVAALTGL